VDALNIGMCLSKLERYEEAVASFLQARKYFKATKDPSDVHHVDYQIALAYIALGNGPEARFYAKHEFNYAKVAENFTAEGVARMHLGKAHALCGEYEEAEAQLVQALEILTAEERKDWEDIIDANRALIDVLFALNRKDEANERLEQLTTIEETFKS
jgi:tetratricopeptide (TPR) repeat protein